MGLLYIGPVRRTLTHSTDTPTQRPTSQQQQQQQVQCTVGTWWWLVMCWWMLGSKCYYSFLCAAESITIIVIIIVMELHWSYSLSWCSCIRFPRYTSMLTESWMEIGSANNIIGSFPWPSSCMEQSLRSFCRSPTSGGRI